MDGMDSGIILLSLGSISRPIQTRIHP